MVNQTGPASWELEDTVLVASGTGFAARHAGVVDFDAYAGAAEVGTSAWSKDEAYAWRLFLETQPCYGVVYRYDSTLVDNRFAMFVQGEWASCPDTTNGVTASHDYSVLVRTVAQGDVGWNLTVVSDTLDFLNNYYDYRDLLDSVRIDPLFVDLQVGIRGKADRAKGGLLEVVPSTGGATWSIASRDGKALDALRVVDASGRDAGRLERGRASWTWHPGRTSGPVWAVSAIGGIRESVRLPVLR